MPRHDGNGEARWRSWLTTWDCSGCAAKHSGR
jgi:hypothetical protein